MPRILIERSDKALASDINKYHLASMYLQSEDSKAKGSILDFIQYAERRYTFLLLVSGATEVPGGAAIAGELPTQMGTSATSETVRSLIPKVEDGKVDGSTVTFKVKGRNRRAVDVIGNSAYGDIAPASPTSGSFFSIILRTKETTLNSVVEFPLGKTARVHGEPRRNPTGDGWIYTFQTFAGEAFSWATWMGGSGIPKTVYTSYNTVGERSQKGYMTWLLPDTFILHATTMRRGANLSGEALVAAGVYKYSFNGTAADGSTSSYMGYSFVSEAEMRRQLNEDLDNFSWDGKSTMRDPFGNLLSEPSQVDEKGDPIYAGDGVREQIRGSNDVLTSGLDGKPVWADYEELITTARDRMDPGDIPNLVFITGPKGADHMFMLYLAHLKSAYNIQGTLDQNKPSVEGYARLSCKKISVKGLDVTVVVDPRMGDKNRYGSFRLRNGEMAKEYEGYLLDFGNKSGRKNITLSAIQSEFVDREYVLGQFNGMTGLRSFKAQHSIDECAMDLLVQRILIVRDTRSCGLLEINPTFVN